MRLAEPDDHALGRSVGGVSTKIHLVTDTHGIPLTATVTAGQMHESTHLEAVLAPIQIRRASGRRRGRPKRIAAERAYDATRLRRWLRQHGIQPAIPPRKRRGTRKRGRPVTYDRMAYRQRSATEQAIGWIKECRAVATRYEKLAQTYLRLVNLAMIKRYLCLLTAEATLT